MRNYDDHYVNIRTNCRLPHDDLVDDPEELEKLSGPCIVVVPAAKEEKTA